MVRRRERVIGTLIVWIAVLLAMTIIIGRMSWAAVETRNTWYHMGNVVTGANPEEANRLFERVQTLSSDLYWQTQQIAQMELLVYLPWLLLISAILLLGGVVSTFLIWRSVIVPEEVSERFARRDETTERTYRPMAVRLDDDGELIHPEIDPQTHQNHR